MTKVLQIIVAFLFFSSQVTSSSIPRTTRHEVDFSGLPRCVTKHRSIDSAITDFGCNSRGQGLKDCICCSEAPFPWDLECSPDSRYAIEGWFRKTCPEVFPVSFDPLSNFIRDQIVFGGLERGCYSLSQSCFCSVSSSDALKYVISNCSEFENSKARKWLRSLCGPEPEENTISVTTVGVVLPTNGSLATPTTSVVMVSSVILTPISTKLAPSSTNKSNSVPAITNSTPVTFSLPSGTTNSRTSSIGLVPVVTISTPVVSNPPPGTTNSISIIISSATISTNLVPVIAVSTPTTSILPPSTTNSVPIISSATGSTNLVPVAAISTPIPPTGTTNSIPNSGTSSIGLVPVVAVSTPVVSNPPPGTTNSVLIISSAASSTPTTPTLPPGTTNSVPNSGISSIGLVPVIAISTPVVSGTPPGTSNSVSITISPATIPTPISPPGTTNSAPIIPNPVSSGVNPVSSGANPGVSSVNLPPGTATSSSTSVTPNTAVMPTVSATSLTTASQTYAPTGPSSNTIATPTTSSAVTVGNPSSSTSPIGDQTSSSATPKSSSIDSMGGNATTPNDSAVVGPPRDSYSLPCISKLAAKLDQTLLFMGPNDPGGFFVMIFVVSLGCFMVTVAFYEWVAAC